MVWVPSAHVIMPTPPVLLLPQEPVPDGFGSWYWTPPLVMISPADTVPSVGAVASSDWHPERAPWNEYSKVCGLFVRPGEKLAVPWSWQKPPDSAPAGAAVTPMTVARANPITARESSLLLKGHLPSHEQCKGARRIPRFGWFQPKILPGFAGNRRLDPS